MRNAVIYARFSSMWRAGLACEWANNSNAAVPAFTMIIFLNNWKSRTTEARSGGRAKGKE